MGAVRLPLLTLLACLCFCSCDRAKRRTVACRWFPNGDPGKCERAQDGRPIVPLEMWGQREFSDDGFAVLDFDYDLYYVNRRGKMASVLPFDNGADYFREGLARTRKNGKIGFFNSELDVIIAPTWDFAFPFESGVAVVCEGCVPRRLFDEHVALEGGKWGYIDKRGKVVVPLIYDEALLPDRDIAAKQAGTVQ